MLNIRGSDDVTGGFALFPDGNVYMNSGAGIRRFISSTQSMDPDPVTGITGSLEPSQLRTTESDKVFRVNGGSVERLYPTAATTSIGIAEVSVARVVGNDIYIGGTDDHGSYMLQKYDSDTDAVTTLSDAYSTWGELQVFHIDQTRAGVIMFDGLNFGTGKYVIGTIDGTSGAITFKSNITGKLDEFKTF